MTTEATVTEQPIIFSGAMVSAILAGRKTQTRRVAKPPAKARFLPDDRWKNDIDEPGSAYLDDESGRLHIICPYGRPGDRLWVRETWWSDRREPGVVVYAATPEWGKYQNTGEIVRARYVDETLVDPADAERQMLPKFWSKRPAIFMPRWASRITLEIMEVRAEQLQDICQEDAYAEGIEEWGLPEQTFSPIVRFHELWDSINGKKYPWSGNPWVWAISFKVMNTS